MLGIATSFVQSISWIDKIHTMDIRQVDLNLLVIFDTMATHRSVIRTAEAVGLSQPATSAALARLRTVFGDPLFVRGGTEMQPTPRALALAPVIHRVVETISLEVLQPAAFDPALADRSFTILTPDIGEISFIPGVLRHLRQAAPQVRLRILSMPRKAAAEALESGQAELAVGFFPDLQKAGFFQQALFRTSYTCIACASRLGNGINPSRLSLKQFLAARHIVVRPEGREHAFDRWLEDKGHRRQVLLELSHFMSLLAILPDSDLIATVPDDIAAAVARHIKINRLELPVKPPVIEVQQYWHRRLQHDPANRWLRGVFHAVNRRDSS
jgi:DNA-binding transcriptional LysR family regulator